MGKVTAVVMSLILMVGFLPTLANAQQIQRRQQLRNCDEACQTQMVATLEKKLEQLKTSIANGTFLAQRVRPMVRMRMGQMQMQRGMMQMRMGQMHMNMRNRMVPPNRPMVRPRMNRGGEEDVINQRDLQITLEKGIREIKQDVQDSLVRLLESY